MRNGLKAIAVICLLATAMMSQTAHAQTPETAKQQDIRRLLKMTGSAELGTQVLTQMLANMKKSLPNVPEAFWADVAKEIHTEELVSLIVPIYDQNLSQEDIRELIKFYGSPTGKKFVSVLPKITEESMAVGQTWGNQLVQKVITKLQSQQQQQPATPADKSKK
ncbi:MAG TPA: DUF2059 domain-containing protein [Polyangia bacterium]|nr:DUF2059 domain-containing protein [Polyangia bacterium]